MTLPSPSLHGRQSGSSLARVALLFGSRRPIDRPSALSRNLLQIRIGIDADGMLRHLQHGLIVHRVAHKPHRSAGRCARESPPLSVRRSAPESGDRWRSRPPTARRPPARGWRAMPNCAAPYSTSQLLVDETAQRVAPLRRQAAGQLLHLRKDSWTDDLGEKLSCRAPQQPARDTMIHGDHFTADFFFADFAGFVLPVTRARPLRNLAADDATLHFPIKEVGAGVAAPQRPVAIENCDGRPQSKDRVNKLQGCARAVGCAQNCFSEEIMSAFDRRA